MFQRAQSGTTLHLVASLALALGVLGSCQEEIQRTDGGCLSDGDCLSGLTCNTTNGACKCNGDDACKLAYPDSNMRCNTFGDCQARPSCVDNRDCDDKPGTYCNTVSGTCIAETKCGASMQCPFGEICDRQTNTCKAGCWDSGDCKLGYICTGAGSSAGQCESNNCTTCDLSTQCLYAQTCDTSRNECKYLDNDKTKLCESCDSGGYTNTCGQGYICLIDTAVADGSYCSKMQCNGNMDCPSGYNECGSLVFVTEQCTSNSCGNGGPCIMSGEESVGFCPCMSDDECVLLAGYTGLGDCTAYGTCELDSRFSCSSATDCEVFCEPFPEADREYFGWPAGTGSCSTRQKVCGKGEGMQCSDLKNASKSPCQKY